VFIDRYPEGSKSCVGLDDDLLRSFRAPFRLQRKPNSIEVPVRLETRASAVVGPRRHFVASNLRKD